MTSAQPGIFAMGTRSHYQLELDVNPAADQDSVIVALRDLRSSTVTAGGINLVIGFGSKLWSTIAPEGERPDAFGDFRPIDGLDGMHAPATQHDIWIWVHGTGEDIALDSARAIAEVFAPVATVALEQPCFVYKDSRDMTGFIDGSANPTIPEATTVACIPPGCAGEAGSFVIAQRWVHDLGAFHALAVEQQEKVFGRTKADSVEFDDEHKPADAHIARAEIDGPDGDEAEIFRRSTPYGRVGEVGLYFLGFSAEQWRFDMMLSRMYGTAADGIRDRLLDFSTAVSGAYYFAPSIDALDKLIVPTDDAHH